MFHFLNLISHIPILSHLFPTELFLDNQPGRDLREKLREKERMQQEKERRLERFKSPKKNRDAPSDGDEKKEKELHITPGKNILK